MTDGNRKVAALGVDKGDMQVQVKPVRRNASLSITGDLRHSTKLTSRPTHSPFGEY